MEIESWVLVGVVLFVFIRLIPIDIKLNRLVLANKRLEDEVRELRGENRKLRNERPVLPASDVEPEPGPKQLPTEAEAAVPLSYGLGSDQSPVAVPALKVKAPVVEETDG